MNQALENDVEKHAEIEHTGAVPVEAFEYGDSLYAKLQRLAGKLKVEQRGIERVPEDERTDTSYFNIGSMVCSHDPPSFWSESHLSQWLAANMVVPSFTIGVLGKPLFNVGFVDAILTILFFNLLSTLTVCFFSTFGPVFGLRQMVLSRFWFGWWGVKVSKFISTKNRAHSGRGY